jgi:hypothetical protein
MHHAIESRVNQREARRCDVAPHVALRARTAMLSLALLTFLVPAARGQAQGSFGLGVGTVRYAGGTSVSTASFSPAWTFDSPNTSLSVGGTLASVPLGVWSSQGRADLWVSTPPAVGGLRLGLQGTGAGTARTDGDRTAAIHGVAEFLWVGRTWGVALGAGPSAGWIVNTSSVTALHTRARGWWQTGTLSYNVSLEPTRFLGAWFTDASANVTANRYAIVTSFWGTARISSAYGSKAAGGVLVRVFPVTRLAFELGAGSYLADPYQGLPRGGYVTAGVRLFTARRSVSPVASQPVWPPLVPPRWGDSVVVRFHMEGASSVAIAGDWDGWQVRALSPLGEDIWESALALRSGTYHFNLLVDGKEWVVPGGVAVSTTSDGGMEGVLVVP